jgi:MoaA/NifB/PqqE/SkfB family radical SAM enzyme
MKSDFRKEYEHPRLLTHLDRLDLWRRGKFFFPITVEISPSANCNQRCAFCYTSYLKYPNLNIPQNVLLNLVKELASIGVKHAFFQGTGEPLLNPATPDAIVAAKNFGLPTVFFSN